jgi:hypothetical protein
VKGDIKSPGTNGNLFNRERDMKNSLKEDYMNVCMKRNVTLHKKINWPHHQNIMCMFVFYLGASLHLIDSSQTEVFFH